MADIVIRGMELPKSGGILCINIFPDGKVTRQLDLSCEQIATAVPLPEGHGRLVDEDEIKIRMTRKMYACRHNSVGELTYAVCIDIVDHADTILEAEGGGEE